MLVGPSTTTRMPRYILIEDFVQTWPHLTADVVEPLDSPLLPILITSPTNTRLTGLSELKVGLSDLEPGYNLARVIMINVRCISQNNYVAEFTEANINASGKSLDEALTNIKALIVDMYDLLSATNRHQLGPEPTSQHRVLASIIRKSK